MEFQLRRGMMKAAWSCSDCSKNKSQAIMSVLARGLTPLSINQPMEKDIKTNNSQFSVSSQQIFLAETPRKKEATVRTENWRDK